jgi:hypothetical protein
MAGREDERVGVVEVPRGVADDDVGAERSQPGHGDRLPGLAAADRDPAVEQDAGERAHPGAGDAHDVHPAEIGQCRDLIRSVAALRTSAAPGASQSSGGSPAWSAVVLMRRTYVARRPR